MSRLVLNSLERNLIQLKITSHSHLLGDVSKTFPCIQCVRFYRPRKPFWLPIAKSKQFRIPFKPNIPEEESVELSRLYNVYRTQMKSLRAYFKEQLMAQTTGPEVIEERKKKEKEHHENCIKENIIWNAEVAKLREERLAKEDAERQEKIIRKILEHEKKQEILTEEINSHIRLEKEAAKSFITSKNIDEAIENALNKVVDNNFCIDLEGNIYTGRYGKPDPKKNTSQSTNKEKSRLAQATN